MPSLCSPLLPLARLVKKTRERKGRGKGWSFEEDFLAAWDMGRVPQLLYPWAILLVLSHLDHGGGAAAVAEPPCGVGNGLGSALLPRLVVRGGSGGDASLEKAKRVAAEKSAKFKAWIESRKTAARAEAAAAGVNVDTATSPSEVGRRSSRSSAEAADTGNITFRLYRVSPHPATRAVMLSHVHASARGRLRKDDWCMGVSDADDLGYISVSVIPGAGGGDIIPAAELAAEQELDRVGGGGIGPRGLVPNGLFSRVLVMKECLVNVGEVHCVCNGNGRWRIKGRLALQREEEDPAGPAGGGKRVAFASSPVQTGPDGRASRLRASASASATHTPSMAPAQHIASRQQGESKTARPDTEQGSSSERRRVGDGAAPRSASNVSKPRDAGPAALPKQKASLSRNEAGADAFQGLASLSSSFEESPVSIAARASPICLDPGGVSAVTLRDFSVGAGRDETPSPLRRARTSSRTPRGKFADSPMASPAASPFAQSDTLMATPARTGKDTPVVGWSSAVMLDDGDAASEVMDVGSHISGAGLAELEDSSDLVVGLRRSRSTGGGDKTVVLSDNVMWGTARGDGREWDSREECVEEDKEEEGRGGQALEGIVSGGRRWEYDGGLQNAREPEKRRYSVGKASSPSRLKPPSSAGSRAQPPARKGTPPPPPTPRRSHAASGAATAVPTAAASTSVEEWLEGMGLGAYASILLEEGWDSMDLIATLTEADLRSLGVKGGHARKMMLYRPEA